MQVGEIVWLQRGSGQQIEFVVTAVSARHACAIPLDPTRETCRIRFTAASVPGGAMATLGGVDMVLPRSLRDHLHRREAVVASLWRSGLDVGPRGRDIPVEVLEQIAELLQPNQTGGCVMLDESYVMLAAGSANAGSTPVQ